MTVGTEAAPSQPAAFINYRLEPYDGQPCLYLYEVMVAEQYQRIGLGTHLMKLVEDMVGACSTFRVSDFSMNAFLLS